MPNWRKPRPAPPGCRSCSTVFGKPATTNWPGRWVDAVQAYEGIRALDAATSGLADDAIAEARRKEAAQRLRRHLSSGFAALERQAFSAAQRAFEQALAMDPNNSSALGGLQQIAEQSVLVEISRLKQQATTLAAAEQWREAADAYRAIMALDANIQFARTGLQQADAQRQTLEALHDLLANADRLSADAHYRGALDTLQKAKQVAPQGPPAERRHRRSGRPAAALRQSGARCCCAPTTRPKCCSPTSAPWGVFPKNACTCAPAPTRSSAAVTAAGTSAPKSL